MWALFIVYCQLLFHNQLGEMVWDLSALQQPVSKWHRMPCDSMKLNRAKQSTLCSSRFPQIPILWYLLLIVAFISQVCLHYPWIHSVTKCWVLGFSPVPCLDKFLRLSSRISSKGFVFNLSGIRGWTRCLENLALICSKTASPCLVKSSSIITSQKEFWFLCV